MAEKDLETDVETEDTLDSSDSTIKADTDDIIESEEADAPIEETEQIHAFEEVHEDEGSSLAAKTLKGLALLVVGGGLALWGAPKLAPHLPQGMAPVAEFLTPSQDAAQARIADLEARLNTRLADLESNTSNVATQKDVQQAISSATEQLQQADTELRDQITATDGQAIESRLAQMETRLDGLAAEIQSVSEGLSGQIVQSGTAVSEGASAQIAAYKAALDGLRAEVDSLSNRHGSLSQRIDEVAAAADRKVTEAEAEAQTKVATAQTQKHLSDIALALDTGSAFEASLQSLAQIKDVSIPDALTSVAQSGTPSLARLKGQYSDVAYAALRADTKAQADAGTTSRLAAFLQSQVGTRSLEPRDGDDADAVLSRIEAALNIGDLSKALAEAQALPPAARDAMADWLNNAQALEDARAGLRTLSADLGAE